MDKERAIEVFVAETLKEYIEYHLENRELLDEDKEILISLLRVVEYMSLRGDYNTYYENKKDIDHILLNIDKNEINQLEWNCYQDHSPENLVQKFKEIYL